MKKRAVKRLVYPILTTLLLLCFSITAFAADSTVTLNNKGENVVMAFEPGSVYTATDLFDNFKGVMPGDTLSEQVAIQNKSNNFDYIKVYLKAILHDEQNNPISEKVLAELSADDRRGATTELEYMYDFLSQLSMKVTKGKDKVIYETTANNLGGLAKKVELGKIEKGESINLDVELNVPIEMDNAYMNRIGEVDWVFTIEGMDYPTPPPDDERVTVRKVWVDDGKDRSESVIVQLQRNGDDYEEITLSSRNQWTYTWGDLNSRYNWSVVEKDVPAGYAATYKTIGNTTTITNTRQDSPPPIPSDETITVNKVWVDDGKERPESVTVQLQKDGAFYEEVELDQSNSWSYTWNELSSDYSWSIIETSVPAGYDASYATVGNITTITNTDKDYSPIIPYYPIDVSAIKVWDDDGKDRPDSVKVTLYNGETAVETVSLGDWNNWSYVWQDLDGREEWQIVEVDIPDGYTPSYSVEGGVVTITNTATLIQSGQLNWPIAVLGGLGVLMLLCGMFVLVTRKKRKDA